MDDSCRPAHRCFFLCLSLRLHSANGFSRVARGNPGAENRRPVATVENAAAEAEAEKTAGTLTQGDLPCTTEPSRYFAATETTRPTAPASISPAAFTTCGAHTQGQGALP